MRLTSLLFTCLFCFFLTACDSDNEPINTKQEENTYDMLHIINPDGRTYEAELLNDYAFVIVKTGCLEGFVNKLKEHSLQVTDCKPEPFITEPFSTPDPYRNTYLLSVKCNYSDIIDWEEVLYAGPFLKGQIWVSGGVDHSAYYTKPYPNPEDGGEQYSIDLDFTKRKLTPLFNIVYGSCLPEKRAEFMAFLEKNKITYLNNSTYYGRLSDEEKFLNTDYLLLSKESTYDPISLVNALDGKYGSFYLRAMTSYEYDQRYEFQPAEKFNYVLNLLGFFDWSTDTMNPIEDEVLLYQMSECQEWKEIDNGMFQNSKGEIWYAEYFHQ